MVCAQILEIYKPCRPSQIIKSEQLVQDVIRILLEDYINPIGGGVDKNTLRSVSSGKPLNEVATEFLLSSPTLGQQKHKDFVNNRLRNGEIPVHDPIKRLKIQSFRTSVKKTTTKQKKSVDVNRDIVAKLLSISVKRGKTINFEKALKFPLGEVPLSICNTDGSMRKTNKSNLAQIILSQMDTSTLELQKEKTAYIVDVMALIRTLTNLSDAFERLTWKMFSCIPKGYHRLAFVADCYFQNSIKDTERSKRGTSNKVIVRSS